MINKDFLQNVDNFDERPLIHMQQALEERSRERQREILPIIKELNKKHREKDKAKLAAKEAERRKQIETFKALFKEGKSLRECARLMGCSTGLLNKLIEEAKFNKIWFTKKELNEIAELKSSRKNVKPSSTPKQAKKASNKELAEEQKNRIVAITNYRKYRKVAKKEDDMELNGNKNVTTDGRKKFIEALASIQDMYMDIPEEDINIILNAFYVHPDIATAESIKFLIMDAKKRGGIELVKTRINDLTDGLKDTIFYTPLLEYQQWIKSRMRYQGLLVSKEDYMCDSEVSQKLEDYLAKQTTIPLKTTVDCDMED